MEKPLAKKKTQKNRALWTNFILAEHFQKNTDICEFKRKSYISYNYKTHTAACFQQSK